jgi:transcriptional regulator with XRE-family HTH domain
MGEKNSREIGQFIIKLREAKNWSQRQAADALGVSNGLLSQLENGTHELSEKLKISIQKVFDFDGPVDWVEHIPEIRIESSEDKILRLQENIDKYAKIRDGLLSRQESRAVFVIGDLCVDLIEISEGIKGSRTETLPYTSGGQGLNSAIAFQSQGYITYLFAGAGKDYEGKKIIDDIENKQHIISLVKEYEGKQTGQSVIFFNEENRKTRYNLDANTPNDANDYPVEYLRDMLKVSGINQDGYIYLVATVFPRYKLRHKKFEEHEKIGEPGKNIFEFYRQDFPAFTGEVIDLLYATAAPIIIRVPQQVGGDSSADGLSLDDFNLLSRADFFIGEYKTFVKIFKNDKEKFDRNYNIDLREDNEDEEIIQKNIESFIVHTDGQAGQYLMFFYGGESHINKAVLYRRGENGAFDKMEGPRETRYAKLGTGNEDPKTVAQERIGFVDQFIADVIWAHDPRNPAEKKWQWEWPKREGR